MVVITVKEKMGECWMLYNFVFSLSLSLIFNSVFDTLFLSGEMKACFLTPKLGPSSATQGNVKWDQERHKRSPADEEKKRCETTTGKTSKVLFYNTPGTRTITEISSVR